MQHALSLGKDKPRQLQDAERATWLFAFNLAAGLDKSEQIARYLERLAAVSAAPVDAGGANWFGRSSSAHWSISCWLLTLSSSGSSRTREWILIATISNSSGIHASFTPTPANSDSTGFP